MTTEIEAEMERDIKDLQWMSEATKKTSPDETPRPERTPIPPDQCGGITVPSRFHPV